MSSGSVKAYGSVSDISMVAEEAFANLWRAAALGTDANSVAIAVANTTKVIGINQTTAVIDAPITIRTAGFSLAYCTGGWTKGDHVTATTAGALETTTTAGDLICGIAMETVSTTEIGMVFLVCPSLRYDSF